MNSREDVAGIVDETLAASALEYRRTGPLLFSVSLPGTSRLSTECALEVGEHTLQVRAFVCRNPDESHQRVYRWLLERNLRLVHVAFAVDADGDICLVGRFAHESVTPALVDSVLGMVAETADSSFNTLLELGFETSIRREWAWRLARGESTRNLDAFSHLRP